MSSYGFPRGSYYSDSWISSLKFSENFPARIFIASQSFVHPQSFVHSISTSTFIGPQS